MKRVVSILLFLTLVVGQNQITGSVTDSNNNPIADANIILENGMGLVSKDDGSFVLNVDELPFLLTVSVVGYDDLTVWVKENNVSLKLNDSPILLDAVNVLANSASITSGMFLRSVYPSAVVSELELRQFDDTDIHRAIARIPGVYVQEEDGLGLRPNIGVRGTGLSRMEKLNVMEDGILIAPAPYASPAAYYSPTMGRMQTLEVRKGSSQIKYGPFTTGGSLNYVSTGIPETMTSKVDLTTGNFGKKVLHLQHGSTEGPWGYLLQVFNDQTTGFKELDGGGDTGYTKADVLAKVRYSMNKNHALEFKYSITDEVSDETYLGLSDEDYNVNPLRRYRASQLDEMDADHSQVVLSYAGKLSDNMSMAVSLYNNEFARNWYKLNKVNGAKLSVVADPSSDTTTFALMDALDSDPDMYRIKANNREYLSSGLQAVLSWNLDNHSLQAGMRIHSDEMDRFQWEDRYQMVAGNLNMTTKATPGSDSNRIDSAKANALFIEDRYTSGAWTVTGGLRYESITVKREDWGKSDQFRISNPSVKEQDFNVVVPGVSVEYAWKPTTTLSYGLHKGFAPHGPGGVKVIDGVTQDVKPETSMNHEWTIRHYEGLSGVELTYFINQYDNLLGADTAASGGGTDELYNGGAVDVSGVELYLRHMLEARNMQFPLELAYTYTNTEFKESFDGDFWGDVSSGDELPYVPSDMLYLNVGVNAGLVSGNVSLKHTAKMRTTAGSGSLDESSFTDAFTVVDASVNYNLKNNVILSLHVKNLLNDNEVVARRPYGVRPTMPRTVSLGLSYTF